MRVRARIACALSLLSLSAAAYAQSAPPVLPAGDAAVAGFSGTTVVGQTLTASSGSWSGSSTSYAFQWKRCDSGGANCINVAGATGQTYTLVAGDAGSTMRVSVTATNSTGSTTASSAATTTVTAEPTPRPARSK